MMNNFKNNLKTLRAESNFSQNELALKLNVSYKTVSHWENGYSEPNIDLILKLKQVFGCTYEELLEYNNV